jgi:L-iditol 2-dehydrogenase
MKALVLKAYNDLQIMEVPEPEIKADEVLIKIAASGICGSDVHGINGSTGRRQPPVIMGHEAAGTIVETGAAVSAWKCGDRVTFDSTIYCGQCPYCRQAHVNLCDNRKVLGVSCDEYLCEGTFAQYIAIPQHILHALPDAVSFEEAAMVEPLSVAFHAVMRSKVKLGDKAVVVGAGVIGLLVIQMLKAAGCSQIIAVDLDEKRLNTAQEVGATQIFTSNKCDTVAKIMDLTGDGVDLAIECVGLTATVNSAVNMLRKGGLLTLIGNLSPIIEFPLQKIVTREITVLGSCASNGEYPSCLDLIAGKQINLAPLMSATVPLQEGAEYFKKLYKKDPNLIKVILNP